jgi:hypothetical protein
MYSMLVILPRLNSTVLRLRQGYVCGPLPPFPPKLYSLSILIVTYFTTILKQVYVHAIVLP